MLLRLLENKIIKKKKKKEHVDDRLDNQKKLNDRVEEQQMRNDEITQSKSLQGSEEVQKRECQID